MELVLKYMTENLQDLILQGFGTGSVMAVMSTVTGYVISKVQSLVNDK